MISDIESPCNWREKSLVDNDDDGRVARTRSRRSR